MDVKHRGSVLKHGSFLVRPLFKNYSSDFFGFEIALSENISEELAVTVGEAPQGYVAGECFIHLEPRNRTNQAPGG